jgi:hypothetical protein
VFFLILARRGLYMGMGTADDMSTAVPNSLYNSSQAFILKPTPLFA